VGALAVGEAALARRKLMACVPPSRHILEVRPSLSEGSSSSSTSSSDSSSSNSGRSMGDGSLVGNGAGTSLFAFDFWCTLAVLPFLGELESSPTTFRQSREDILSTCAPDFLPYILPSMYRGFGTRSDLLTEGPGSGWSLGAGSSSDSELDSLVGGVGVRGGGACTLGLFPFPLAVEVGELFRELSSSATAGGQ
jgi:hypothetical protein